MRQCDSFVKFHNHYGANISSPVGRYPVACVPNCVVGGSPVYPANICTGHVWKQLQVYVVPKSFTYEYSLYVNGYSSMVCADPWNAVCSCLCMVFDSSFPRALIFHEHIQVSQFLERLSELPSIVKIAYFEGDLRSPPFVSSLNMSRSFFPAKRLNVSGHPD